MINEHLAKKYKCKILAHPGYNIPSVEDQVVKYAKEINKAKITLTCSSKYKYALAKYSEIPLCNSLLIADVPDENKDWYKNWMVEVSNDFSDYEIMWKISYFLSKPDLIKERTKEGVEENLKYRIQECYADRFVNIVKSYLKI